MINNVIEKSISYNGKNLIYYLQIKDIKNLIIKIKDKKIIVSSPPYVNEYEIITFLNKNLDKIYKKLQQTDINYNFIVEKNLIRIFGQYQKYILKNKLDDNDKNYPFIFKYYKNNKDLIKHLYKKLAQHFYTTFKKYLDEWAKNMQLNYKNLTVNYFSGKWGSCDTKKRDIKLNITLIHCPKELIEIVIIHELAHLKYANHSKPFYNLIRNYKPNYNELNKRLNKYMYENTESRF